MSISIPKSNLQERVKTFRWALPIGLFLLSVFYQLGPARWVHDRFHENAHFLVEILFYGLVGPFIVYLAFNQIQQWLLEKEQAEHAARSSQRRLASITEASADAIIGLRPDGTIESWNNGAELILGYMEKSIHDQPFWTLLGGRESSEVEWNWLAEMVRSSGFVRGYETTCQHVEGKRVSIELTATYLADEQGHPSGFSVILRDVTGRKLREAEIHELNTRLNELVQLRTQELAVKVDELADANDRLQKLDQTRSEFVSLVSHQIRAPLTNMRGAVEKMQLDCGRISPTCMRMFTVLNQQVERLDRLVRDVLSATRIEMDQLILQQEPVSVLPLVEQAVEQMRTRSSDRQIIFPSKPGLPLAFADPDRVLEILANLLDNAAKYSPAGIEIAVDVRGSQSEITISVRDHGEGIPAQDLTRIFEKFYRADSSDSQVAYGYGLGLYICKKLVDAQGGKIWAENHLHGGAVFSFTLPVWQGSYD